MKWADSATVRFFEIASSGHDNPAAITVFALREEELGVAKGGKLKLHSP